MLELSRLAWLLATEPEGSGYLLIPCSGITRAHHHAWTFFFFMSEEEARNPKIGLIISTLWKMDVYTASSNPKTRPSQATVQIHVWTIKTKKKKKFSSLKALLNF